MKLLSWLLIAALVVCGVAYWRGAEDVEVSCGPVVTVPLITKGTRHAKSFGENLAQLRDGEVTTADVVLFTTGMWHTLGVMWDQMERGFRGEDDNPDAKTYEKATRQAQNKALAGCCPAAPVDPTPPDVVEPPNTGRPPDDGDEWDPKMASLQLADPNSQLALVATSNAVGARMGVSKRGQVISIGTMLVESEIQNLSYGDRDSVGPWQQRAGWGTVSQRMQPSYGAKKFFQALERVPNWETRPMGQVAQAVQISAYPAKYQTRMAEAEQWWARAGGADQAPVEVDPEDPAVPAYCNPSSAERNTGAGGTVTAIGSSTDLTKAIATAKINNPRTPEQALAWLARQKQNTSSQCLHYVAAAYGYNSTQPAPPPFTNGGGEWGADEQWRLIPARYKHPGDENAPVGAVLWFAGGNPDGHVALMAPNGMVRSTGVGPGGGVGDKPFAYFKSYGYVGWSLPYWPSRSTIGVAA